MFTYQNTYQCCTLDESISRFCEEISSSLNTEIKNTLTIHRAVMVYHVYIIFKNDKVLDIKIELNKKKLMWVCICEELDKESLFDSIHKEMILDKEGSSANSRGRLFGFRAERFLRDIAQ